MFFLKPAIAFIVFITLATLGHSNFLTNSPTPTRQSNANNIKQMASAINSPTPSTSSDNSAVVNTPSDPTKNQTNISVSQNKSVVSQQTGSSSSSINITINGQTISSSSQNSVNSSPTADSGIQGTALIFPSCPAAQTTSCQYRLINQLTVTNTNTGQQVTTITPGTNGAFSISLPPGNYTLAPRPSYLSNSTSLNQTYSVTVQPNTYSQVSISISDN